MLCKDTLPNNIRNIYSQKRNCASQSQFLHSCFCVRFIYSHDRSAYSAARIWVYRSIAHRHMNVEIGTWAGQLLFGEYINQNFLQCGHDRRPWGRIILWLVNGYSTWPWLRCYANVNLTGTVWLRAQLDGTPVTRRCHEICWHLLVEQWHMGHFISDDRHSTLGSVNWNRKELYRTKEF